MPQDAPDVDGTFDTQLTAGDRQFLEDQINEFNVAQTHFHDFQWLGFVLREARGAILAGIAGWTWGGCCEIRSLWVHEAMRRQGLGRRLLALAEREAAARGCAVVVLDTHSFQAPEFYQKHGYALAGLVDGYPRGHRKYFFYKNLG